MVLIKNFYNWEENIPLYGICKWNNMGCNTNVI
jgi:hypothetical protein